MSEYAMHSFGLPGCRSGLSAPGRRIVEAGLRFQQSKAPHAPASQPPPAVVLSPRDEVQNAAREAKEKADREMAQRVKLIQVALDSFNNADVKAFGRDPVPKPQLLAALVAGIKADACRIFDVTPTDLISERRCCQASLARQYVAQRLRDESPLSFPQIGRTLGGRDHSTVVHACRPAARAKVIAWIEKLAEAAGR